MASTMDGVKGYCLNYDSRIMYPYTLLDCIIAPDGSTSGSAAIIEGLIGDNINTDCVLGFKRAEGGLVALGRLQDISNPPQFLGETGAFREINMGDLAHGLSVYLSSTPADNLLVDDGAKGKKLAMDSAYFGKGANSSIKLRSDVEIDVIAKSANKLNNTGSLTGNWLYEFSSGLPAKITAVNAGLNTTDAKLIEYGNNGFAFSTKTLGNTKKPVYLLNGKFTECDDMSGLSVETANKLACSESFESIYVGKSNTARWVPVPPTPGTNTYVLSVAVENSTPIVKWENVGSMTAISFGAPSTSQQYYVVGTTNTNGINSTTGAVTDKVYFKNGTLYNTSDERLKTFTDNIDINLDNLATIKKGLFYWNDDEEKRIDIGVTAQSVEALYPQLVDEVNGTKHVAYAKLSVVALAAIDKLNRENKKLKKDIQNLEDKIKYLEDKLDEI